MGFVIRLFREEGGYDIYDDEMREEATTTSK
jgi:hypothetical protein